MVILSISYFIVLPLKSLIMRRKKIIHMYVESEKIYVDIKVGEFEFFYHVPYENYKLI